MAKLKIEHADHTPVIEGYINVATQMFSINSAGEFNFDKYKAENPPGRPALLQKFARGPEGAETNNVPITQQPQSGPPEVINSTNCRIHGDPDEKRNGANPSKVTVPLPDAPPSNPVSGRPIFEYLMVYADAIADLHSQISGPNDLVNIDRCTKFMFGMMMLTRCR